MAAPTAISAALPNPADQQVAVVEFEGCVLLAAGSSSAVVVARVEPSEVRGRAAAARAGSASSPCPAATSRATCIDFSGRIASGAASHWSA